jgi:hypothetical protein
VLVVPRVTSHRGRFQADDVRRPSEDLLKQITARLELCRIVGARVLIEPPRYAGMTVVARITPRPRTHPGRLQEAAMDALYTYFHPLDGGPDGKGWPFGRPVHVGEVYSVLQALNGTEVVEEAQLFPFDFDTGKHGDATQRLVLGPNDLVYSHGHHVLVQSA